MTLVDGADDQKPATTAVASVPPREAPTQLGVKRKLIRGGIVLAVLVAVVIGVVGLLPGLSGVRSAIGSASVGWVLAAAGIQIVGTAGAVVFVQLVSRTNPPFDLQDGRWDAGGERGPADRGRHSGQLLDVELGWMAPRAIRRTHGSHDHRIGRAQPPGGNRRRTGNGSGRVRRPG
jgi:hypothetical protein